MKNIESTISQKTWIESTNDNNRWVSKRNLWYSRVVDLSIVPVYKLIKGQISILLLCHVKTFISDAFESIKDNNSS